MKVRRSVVTPFAIPFRGPLQTGHGTLAACCGVLVQVESACGCIGIGEATLPPAATATLGDGLRRSVAHANVMLADAAIEDAIERLDALPLPVRVGFEAACYDLLGQSAGKPVADLFGRSVRNRIPVNALVNASAPAAAAAAARQAVADGFHCIKLKVGRDIGLEAARLTAIRDAVGPGVAIRIDANGAWTVAEAIAALDDLAPCGLEYVEQPVAGLAALAGVRGAVATAIAVDESIEDADDVEQAAELGAADIVVLKPSRLGLRRTIEAIQRAARCGLRVVLTSNLDTSVGIAAAVHLAALLPEPALPCGLATLALLGGDLARPSLHTSAGFLPVPERPGLGVELDSAAVARWRTDA